MSNDAMRGALWAIERRWLRQPHSPCREYVFVEVQPSRLAERLATVMAVDEREVMGRLERGCRAFAWDWRGEVVSWLWVSTGQEWAPPLRRCLHFPDGDCHGWGAGTLADHRGHGLFASLLGYAAWRMAREGCPTMWTGVLDSNLASQRGHLAAGFRPVLRLAAYHQPPPTRVLAWPADYTDEQLVARARCLLGDDALHITDSRSRADVSAWTRERARELARSTTEHITTGLPQTDGRLAAGAGSGAR